MTYQLVIAAHVFATVFMTGLIWFVQIVHYPLYSMIGQKEFPSYQQRHQILTTIVVGPVMLLEVGSAIAWLYWVPIQSSLLMWTAVALLMVVWLSTAVLQVPAHGRLAEEYSAKVHQRLVSTNWIRTFAWTARSLIVSILAFSDGHFRLPGQ